MTKLMGRDFAKLTVLAGNIAHDYEHYGNMWPTGLAPVAASPSGAGRLPAPHNWVGGTEDGRTRRAPQSRQIATLASPNKRRIALDGAGVV